MKRDLKQIQDVKISILISYKPETVRSVILNYISVEQEKSISEVHLKYRARVHCATGYKGTRLAVLSTTINFSASTFISFSYDEYPLIINK